MKRTILIAADGADQSRRFAALVRERAEEAVAARGQFTLVLGGGTSVRAAYHALAAERGMDWSRTLVFWGDERFIEPESVYSNYRLAREALLDSLPGLPRTNVFPVPVDAATPTLAALQYSETIRSVLGLGPQELPRFDLTVNGMGPDGHTASLFPHAPTPPSFQIARMAHAGLAPWIDRVTLTMPVFNQARTVLFLAAGTAKAAMLKQVLEGEPNSKHWPASGVRPPDGEVIWLLEPGIAGLLTNPAG